MMTYKSKTRKILDILKKHKYAIVLIINGNKRLRDCTMTLIKWKIKK